MPFDFQFKNVSGEVMPGHALGVIMRGTMDFGTNEIIVEVDKWRNGSTGAVVVNGPTTVEDDSIGWGDVFGKVLCMVDPDAADDFDRVPMGIVAGEWFISPDGKGPKPTILSPESLGLVMGFLGVAGEYEIAIVADAGHEAATWTEVDAGTTEENLAGGTFELGHVAVWPHGVEGDEDDDGDKVDRNIDPIEIPTVYTGNPVEGSPCIIVAGIAVWLQCEAPTGYKKKGDVS